MKLAIVLTMRLGSERLPNKGMLEVCGRPLAYWITERLKLITPGVVLATTTNAEDDALDAVAQMCDVPIYHGSVNDVIGRMEEARKRYAPDAEYVLRGLGDCPFLDPALVTRAVDVMDRVQAEAFRWHLAPNTWPVYGAREFPYALDAWNRIYRCSTEREHVDAYYMEHVDEFVVAWHEPPPAIYFRPYRLEIDWLEDLELIRKIGERVGMLAPLPVVINYLDHEREVSLINRTRVEKTGPTVSYDYKTQRDWMHAMEGKPVVTWDDHVWYPPSQKAQPVFCQSGQDFIGFALGGVLYTRQGQIKGSAKLECACGSGKFWNNPKPHTFGRSASVGRL